MGPGAESAANSGKVTSSLGAAPSGPPRGPLGRSGGQGGESAFISLKDLARFGLQNGLQVADIAPLGSELSSWWLGREVALGGREVEIGNLEAIF